MSTTAAFLTALVRVPLAALKIGIGSPPACVANLTSHPIPSHPAAQAIGNVHCIHHSLSFVPWVSAHVPFPARASFLAIMSALTLPTNLNRAVVVPRPAKGRIVPLSRVRGTLDVSGALAQVNQNFTARFAIILTFFCSLYLRSWLQTFWRWQLMRHHLNTGTSGSNDILLLKDIHLDNMPFLQSFLIVCNFSLYTSRKF